MTLTEFLLARIAEDEARIPSGLAQVTIGGVTGYVDPAAERMRLECEAKRRIVGIHEHQTFEFQQNGETIGCIVCHSTYEDYAGGWCPTLRALALPYADHPNYLPEWRP